MSGVAVTFLHEIRKKVRTVELLEHTFDGARATTATHTNIKLVYVFRCSHIYGRPQYKMNRALLFVIW